jgi:ABC-type amino acid transport substrate-binding protein
MGEVADVRPFAIASGLKNRELIDKIDYAIERLRENGEYISVTVKDTGRGCRQEC